MMNCPKCGQAGHTRSSHSASTTTKERYYQCQNINCGCTFVTHESLARYIVKPGEVEPAPPHPNRYKQQQLWM